MPPSSNGELNDNPHLRRVTVSPNTLVLPEGVFRAVCVMMHTLGENMTEQFAASTRLGRNGGPLAIEVIVVADDEAESLLACEVNEMHPGHFTVAISVTLVGFLYCLLVILVRAPKFESNTSAIWSTRGHTVQHRTRLFAEALNILCRDNREPRSLLRRLFFGDICGGSRWTAVEQLAELVVARSVPRLDSLGSEPHAAELLIDVLWLLAVHEVGHVAGRHAEIAALAEAENWGRLTEEAFIWCSEIDADVYAQSSLLDCKLARFADLLAENPVALKERLWIAQNGLIMLVNSLIHVQEAVLAENTRIDLLANRQGDCRSQAADVLLAMDRYPRASFRANLATYWLATQLYPENTADKFRDSIPLRRALYGLKVCAAADWLESSDLLALAALPFSEPGMHEGEFTYYEHYRPIFLSIRQEVEQGAAT